MWGDGSESGGLEKSLDWMESLRWGWSLAYLHVALKVRVRLLDGIRAFHGRYGSENREENSLLATIPIDCLIKRLAQETADGRESNAATLY